LILQIICKLNKLSGAGGYFLTAKGAKGLRKGRNDFSYLCSRNLAQIIAFFVTIIFKIFVSLQPE